MQLPLFVSSILTTLKFHSIVSLSRHLKLNQLVFSLPQRLRPTTRQAFHVCSAERQLKPHQELVVC